MSIKSLELCCIGKIYTNIKRQVIYRYFFCGVAKNREVTYRRIFIEGIDIKLFVGKLMKEMACRIIVKGNGMLSVGAYNNKLETRYMQTR